MCILVLAVEVSGDELSSVNVAGLALCLFGIIGHIVHKVRSKNRGGLFGGGRSIYIKMNMYARAYSPLLLLYDSCINYNNFIFKYYLYCYRC